MPFIIKKPITIIILILLAIFWPTYHLSAQELNEKEVRLLPPQITIYPQTYIAGEQTLYLEGTAPPNSDITIYLKRGGDTIKKWQSTSNEKGDWSFSTNELIESGSYDLMARAEKNEIVSDMSEKHELAIKLSGVAIGSFLISFKVFVLTLGLFLILLVVYALIFIIRGRMLRKNLRRETWEVRQVLIYVFENLSKDIEKRIELFDAQPGFSEEEKKVYEDLKKYLLTAQISIEKEIRDVENIL